MYRKRKLELEEEHESLVNILDVICTVLMLQEVSDHFRQVQGFDLLINLCRKQSQLRRHLIRLFDYAVAQYRLPLDTATHNARAFIEASGLPVLFGFFMISHKHKVSKAKITD